MRFAAAALLLSAAALAHAGHPAPPAAYGKPLGIGGGVTWSSHLGAAPWATVNLRLRLNDRLALEPEATLWARSPDSNYTLDSVLEGGRSGRNRPEAAGADGREPTSPPGLRLARKARFPTLFTDQPGQEPSLS